MSFHTDSVTHVKAVQFTTPIVAAICAVLIGTVPLTLLGGGVPSPLFALMPVYFWVLVRPDVMNTGWVFVIGLLQDLLSGGAPGIWALAFIITYYLLDKQRDNFAGLSGIGALLGFACAALTTQLSAYLIYALAYQHFMPTTPFIIQFAVTVLLYIPAAYIISFLHRRFVGPMREDD